MAKITPASVSELRQALASVNVINCATKETVPLPQTLPENKPFVLYIVRRFGCPLCRNYAKSISEVQPEIEKLGASMVAFGHQQTGMDEFVSNKFWAGDLYVDESLSIHKALGTSRGSLFQLFSGKVWKASREAMKSSVGGDMKGDGLQLGGVWVFDAAGNPRLAHLQKNFTDLPSAETILDKVKEACSS